MILDDFIKKWNGKQCEVAGSANAKNQCVDLANAYIRDVLGLPIIEWTDAKDFPTKAGDKYNYIKNTPLGVPKRGDIIVWGSGAGGGYGHIAIYLDGGVNTFTSFDQNWSVKEFCKIENHRYNNVIGWLRPKGESMEITPEERDRLINRATVAKEVAQFLEIAGDPDTISFDQIKSVIAGIKARAKDMEGKAGEWEAECKNRIEQVGRLKAQLLEQGKLYKALSDKLKSSNDLSVGTIGLLEGRIEVLQEQVNVVSAEKGELNKVIAMLKLKREYDILIELAKYKLALVKFK